MQQLAPAHFNTNETDKIDMVLCELSQNRRNSWNGLLESKRSGENLQKEQQQVE